MEHTSKQFEIELEDLRSGLLAMGGLVEAQLERALEAIASHEDELVEVVLREEKRVNDKQLELDRKGMEIIARRQPATCVRLSAQCRQSMTLNASATRSKKWLSVPGSFRRLSDFSFCA
jgi:hypothetical protein